MMKTKIDFRKSINQALRAQKMSVPDLARKVQLNPQTIYNYLAGRSEMTAASLEKIFSILKIKIT